MKRFTFLLIIFLSLFLLASCSKSEKKNNKEQLDRLFTMKNKFSAVSSVQLQTDLMIEFDDKQEPTTYSYTSIAKMKRTPFESFSDNTLSKVQKDKVDSESIHQFIMENDGGFDVYTQKKENTPFIKLNYSVDEFSHDLQSYPNFVLMDDFLKLVTEDTTIVSDEATALVYREKPTTKIGADLTIALVEKILNRFPITDMTNDLPSLDAYKDLVVGEVEFYISDGNELEAIEFNFDKGMVVLKRMGVNLLSLRLTFSETNNIKEINFPAELKLR